MFPVNLLFFSLENTSLGWYITSSSLETDSSTQRDKQKKASALSNKAVKWCEKLQPQKEQEQEVA